MMDHYRIELSRDPESGLWMATSTTLPGLITGERTISEALRKAGLVIEAMKAEQVPEPVDYRTLLKKYIRHVWEYEGSDFLYVETVKSAFTDAEHSALLELKWEGDAEAT